MVRFLAIFAVLLLFVFAACTSDCIYKLYETSDGSELCGRFCPKEDEEGNTVLDDNGDVVYDKPEPVDKTNCILPNSTTGTTSSTSSTSG